MVLGSELPAVRIQCGTCRQCLRIRSSVMAAQISLWLCRKDGMVIFTVQKYGYNDAQDKQEQRETVREGEEGGRES